jgi:membrane protein DedA with SNARE-associated domain
MDGQVAGWIADYGYPAIFLLLTLGIVGLPVPDETLLTVAGYLVAQGRLHPVPAFVAALAGSICGITISYRLGSTFGLGLIHRYGRYLRLREEHILRAHAWFERFGRWMLTIGYFIPGVRHVTAFAAGISELDRVSFALFAYGGALLWVSTFMGLGYWLGERWRQVEPLVHRYGAAAGAALLAGAAVWLVWKVRKKS